MAASLIPWLKSFGRLTNKLMDAVQFCCVKEYISPYPNSIIFREGEIVFLGEEFDQDPDWKGWIRCRGREDRVAWIPKSYLMIDGDRGTLTREYDARELDLSVDEIVIISEIVSGFGFASNQKGEFGWVPMNHLEPHTSAL